MGFREQMNRNGELNICCQTPISHAKRWFCIISCLQLQNRLNCDRSHSINLQRIWTQSQLIKSSDPNTCTAAATYCISVSVCMCVRALCSLYLKDLDGIGPVRVGVLPRFAIRQALGIHVQIENGVVFWVLDLTLKQLHDVQESLQGAADVYDCRQNKSKRHF